MELEKYDCYEWIVEDDDGDNEVMQYTGLYYMNEKKRQQYVFAIIKSTEPEKINDIHIIDAKGIKSSFRKISFPGTHPLIREVVAELKKQVSFRRELAKALSLQFQAATKAEQQSIIEMLRQILPKKFCRRLHPGELCGKCLECSKRLERNHAVLSSRKCLPC